MEFAVNGADDIAARLRIEEYRRMGIRIGEEFGVWNATLPAHKGSERTLARYTRSALLADVDEILAGGDPRADPG